jgi:hypothetical protein
MNSINDEEFRGSTLFAKNPSYFAEAPSAAIGGITQVQQESRNFYQATWSRKYGDAEE